MSDKLFSFEEMQVHTAKIKAVLDSQGWYYKGSDANFGYIYRNDAPSVTFQGVGNSFTAQGNSVTITASAYNENCLLYVADSDATISSAAVTGGAKISANDIEITILGKTSGDTISLQLGNNTAQPYTIG